MRTDMTESVQHLEQREMNIDLEYADLKDRADAMRNELHTEIERMLNDVIKFKLHIQAGLESYNEFVDEVSEKDMREFDGEQSVVEGEE